ncbi:hypothetical protein Back11_21190 [Paenibacillus baekrokdamisoli]|uniref:Signal transduction histidine-protein kinase ArlS n=1 Tax=Paenibacillus baekrokdamisoli TaxID=1712516 RepID=A0A3G9JBV8_9BACL|nr:hypothetical protein Back11_21190 [Paenibacillus baekrokdamisoli]
MWSSLFIVTLFLAYAGTQYLILNQWTMKQEQQTIQKSVDEIKLYFQDKSISDMPSTKSFLTKLNQKNQMIRILDHHGIPILTVTEDFEEKWVTPVTVKEEKIERKWHVEDHFLLARSPLKSGDFTGTLEIAINLENFEKLNKLMISVMAIGGLIGVVLCFLGGIILARQFVKPITALSETIDKIKHHGLTERVVFAENGDELSRLSQMFNEMMDRLELSFHQQKQFVEDASHELRTPIAIIEGHLAMLNRWGKNDPVVLDESLNASLQELNRLKTFSQELLALTRAEGLSASNHPEMEPAQPYEIVNQIVGDFQMLYPNFEFELQLQPLKSICLLLPADHWKQIVMIILDNAVKYSTDKKIIELEASQMENNRVQLRIRDYGIGIPSEEIGHVFDRFYRVDKARTRLAGGSGLGLAIAKRLIETYEGQIEMASTENEGSVVTLTMPYIRRKL